MSAEGLVFVDTNFLIYAFSEGSDPRHSVAQIRFQELVEQDRLCLSTQVLQELFVNLTKKLRMGIAEAIVVIEDVAQYPVFQVDKRAIVDAGWLVRDAGISFWDSLIVVAASRMGAKVLLTEDLNSGQIIGSVRVENPFLPA